MFSTGNIIKAFVYPAVAGACAYLNLDQEILSVLAILVMIDFVTGIARAYRVGERITSARMWSGAVSKTLLIFIPFILGLCFKVIGGDTHKVLASMLAILVVAETYSSIANIAQVIKGEKIEEFDVISMILGNILNKLKQIIENILK